MVNHRPNLQLGSQVEFIATPMASGCCVESGVMCNQVLTPNKENHHTRASRLLIEFPKRGAVISEVVISDQ